MVTIDIHYKNKATSFRVPDVTSYYEDAGQFVMKTIWGYEIEIPLNNIERWEKL